MAYGKKKRFEVFKRDRFTCQYCGRKAPDVVLHVDHVHPRAKGGKDDVLNLITSCVECNSGKGARELSDDSVLAKQRSQLEQLQERREQLEMMVEWQRSLVDLDTRALDAAIQFWCDLAGWVDVNELGRDDVRKLLRRHSLDDVLQAMRDATGYFKTGEDGNPTSESTNHGFNKISSILRIKIAEQDKPWLKDLFYTRGIVRNRMYCNDQAAKQLLELAYEQGIPTEITREIALNARNWTQWQSETDDLLEDWGE